MHRLFVTSRSLLPDPHPQTLPTKLSTNLVDEVKSQEKLDPKDELNTAYSQIGVFGIRPVWSAGKSVFSKSRRRKQTSGKSSRT
jgi:hypothetical protein